eukprot:Ihof_evm9s154 gene=Ihof_evmTU9s154
MARGALFVHQYSTDNKDHRPKPIYIGPLSAPMKRLKMFSITGCSLSLIGTPSLFYMQSGIAPLGKAVFASIVFLTGLGSTALVTFFTKPYIHRMWFTPDLVGKQLRSGPTNSISLDNENTGVYQSDQLSGQLVVETLSIFGRPVIHTFSLDE